MPQSYVLVVDPNPATHRRVEAALDGCALGLLSARNASDAANSANGHDIALVLSATSLPRGNGYDLARELRDRHPAAAVLLMAGGFEVYNKNRAEEAGVVGYLPKPFTADKLLEEMESAIGPLPRTVEGSEEALPSLPRAAVSPIETETVPDVVASHDVRPLASDERVATVLPRDYDAIPVVAVDPEVVGPALERAILEVLPEVVEAVLRNALDTSPSFRDLVDATVKEVTEARLPEVARQVIQARLDEVEAELADVD